MHIRINQLILLVSACASAIVLAQDPPLDLSLDPNELLSPNVNIQEHENRTTQEFSVNGNVYAIKVNPNAGPSYYLMDPNGTGEFEWRRDVPGADLNIPQWALVTW